MGTILYGYMLEHFLHARHIFNILFTPMPQTKSVLLYLTLAIKACALDMAVKILRKQKYPPASVYGKIMRSPTSRITRKRRAGSDTTLTQRLYKSARKVS